MIGIFLLITTWLGIYTLCRELAARGSIACTWRISWALACVGWGALLTLIVEISSLLQAFHRPAILIAWSISAAGTLGAAVWLAWRRGKHPRTALHALLARLRAIAAAAGNSSAPDSRRSPMPPAAFRHNYDLRLIWGATVLIVLCLGCIALLFPATIWDSMTYHMPRVMHWVQQQSVEHYPTNNTRQLESGPWASFAVAMLYLCWGNDQLVNGVQWFAMLGSVVVTPLIARQLLLGRLPADLPAEAATRPDRSGQLRIEAWTALLVATLPIGVTQSITTQNDYVTAYWLVCLVCLSLALLSEPNNRWYLTGAGLALSLGILTKATFFIYATPLVIVVGIWFLWKVRRIHLIGRVIFVFTVALLLLNLPHLARNYAIFQSPLGSPVVFSLVRNKDLSPGALASNIIRNLALQVNTGIPPLTTAINSLLLWLHHFTGKALSDPATTFYGQTFSFPTTVQISGSVASNPYHLFLALFAALAARPSGTVRDWRLLLYGLSIVFSFVIFCLYLIWQPWHTRLHLAYFLLLAPFTATLLIPRLFRPLIVLVSLLLVGWAGYCVAYNMSRPLNPGNTSALLPREQQYLLIKPHLYEPTIRAAGDIIASGCQQVGIKMGFDDWEYPLWVALSNRGYQGRIDHVLVENESAGTRALAELPCALITTLPDLPAGWKTALPHRIDYGPFAVYMHTGVEAERRVGGVQTRASPSREPSPHPSKRLGLTSSA